MSYKNTFQTIYKGIYTWGSDEAMVWVSPDENSMFSVLVLLARL